EIPDSAFNGKFPSLVSLAVSMHMANGLQNREAISVGELGVFHRLTTWEIYGLKGGS
ncbi:hypothetical protein NPIL_650991, partial [Nephila pilipes]